MSDQPEKFDLRSQDIVTDKQAALLAAFPEVFTEGGKIDFERLRLALGDSVDIGKERYGMNWPGKADCFKTIQQPSMATLVPCPAESWPPAPFSQPRMDANERESQKENPRKTGDGSQASAAKKEEGSSDIRVDSRPFAVNTSENLIIEGDNLEVLKLLQKSYLGKVKMIYIDPPYNTGNDFIYPDNYSESLETYLRYTGQVDSEGRKYSTNTEADGRFHSKWLNMMYPRLYLARNLLREDGVIFISIDDHEVDNLKKLCNEIFGEECFAGQVAVVNNLKGRNDRKHLATAHEYLLVFARSEFETLGLPLTSKQLAEYKEADDSGFNFQWRDLRKRGGADTRAARPKLFFPIFVDPENGDCAMAQSDKFRIEVFPLKGDGTDGCWRWGFRRIERAVTTLKATKVENRNRWNISYRVYLEKDGQERVSKPKSVWIGPEFSTDAATKALKGLIPDLYTFTPKPVDLLKVIAQQSLDEDDLCLDFFSGSGTTGQAVLELNNQDGGNRKFILVQLPEPTERKDFPTIADITKERVRRVIQKISREDAESAKEEAEANTLNLGGLAPSREAKQDLGFKVFKLQGSNFKTWNADVAKDAAAVEAQMEMHIRHIVDGRTQEDLLYEILLKSGFPLTTPIETLTLAGKTVFSTGTMLVCLEKKLTPEVIKEMAARKPERVVCLDEGFAGNDQLKTNAVQTMKTKGVISFKTV